MEEIPPKKKRQHFVSQRYLRNFSNFKNISNKEECLYVYPFKTRQSFISNVKYLCKEDFFYGDDERSQKFENNLSIFERRQARIIQKIIDYGTISVLSKDEYTEFLLFLLMQDARTKRSKRAIKEFTQMMVKNVIKPQLKMRERPPSIPEDFVDNLDIEFQGDFALRMLGAIGNVEGLTDLKAIVVNNVTHGNFFCSDHPVVRYNYINFKNSSSIDYLAPGLIFFYPLNNEMMVLLFDEKAYSVALDFDSVICLNDVSDLDAINKLQFINADDYVLFSAADDIENVKRIHQEVQQFMGHDSHVEKEEIVHEDGSKTLILHHCSEKPDYQLNLSFISLNEGYVEYCMGEYEKTTEGEPGAKPIRNLKLAAKVNERHQDSESKIKEIIKNNPGQIFKITPPSP